MKLGKIGAVAVAAIMVVGCGKQDAAADGGKTAETAAKPAASAVDPKKVAVQVNDAKLTYGELDGDIAKIIATQNIPAEQAEPAQKHFREQLAQLFVMKTLLM